MAGSLVACFLPSDNMATRIGMSVLVCVPLSLEALTEWRYMWLYVPFDRHEVNKLSERFANFTIVLL